MKIALVSPLYMPLPPRHYGGTERIVSYLADEFCALGHEVTVFCCGGSTLACRMHHTIPDSLWENPAAHHAEAAHILQWKQVLDLQHSFDVIHVHTGYLHILLKDLVSVPMVTTFHGRLDRVEIQALLEGATRGGLISISHAQRKQAATAPWLETVPNGIPEKLYQGTDSHQGYLAFIGRFSPEKGIADAAEIARRCGLPLRVAGAPDKGVSGESYYNNVVAPLFSQPGNSFVGEIGDADKQAFLGQAAALLFPVSWPEPFGLTMIEAMACGTPVIAYDRGSVPEVVENGVTGYRVHSAKEAAAAVEDALVLDRRRIRSVFEARFTTSVMARAYLDCYARMGARSLAM